MAKPLANVDGIAEGVAATGSSMDRMEFHANKCSCLEGSVSQLFHFFFFSFLIVVLCIVLISLLNKTLIHKST